MNPFSPNFADEMKKLLTLLIMLVYGFASIGATLHLHYCCGKLDKVSFSTTHNKDCPNKGKAFKRCCESKKVDVKLKADHEPVAKWIASQKALSSALPKAIYIVSIQLRQATVSVFTTGPPTPRSSVPLFIRNCVFRI